MNDNELTALVVEIKILRDAYWAGNTQVPDSVYDAKIEQLRKENPYHPLLTSVEYGSQIVGDTVKHSKPMLSLEKVYTEDELFAWVKKISRTDDEGFIVQPKYDGVSCHFFNGTFATRGDGEIGQNITAVCRYICQMETKGSTDDFYGELVIKKSVFNTAYKNIVNGSGKAFKNSRNAVAGILGTDDFTFYSNQGAIVTLIDYDKNSYPITKKDFEFKWSVLKSVITALDFPMDGIVVKLQDQKYSESLGCTSHHPKGQVAFKFDNQVAETRLLGVEYGMGREQLTAVAIFEPVEINGVEISRAVIPLKSRTLPCILNGDFTEGSTLVIERAGDVIPHIISISTTPFGKPFAISTCPFCGSSVVVQESSVICANPDCKEKNVQKLIAGLKELGLKNVGEATIRKVSNEIGRTYRSKNINLHDWFLWFGSSEYPERMANVQGFGGQSISNLYKEVQKIRNTTYEKFIASLCIPGVGTKIATEIMKAMSFKELMSADINTLSGVSCVGGLMAERIHNYFIDSFNRNYVQSLSNFFNFETKQVLATTGKTVCFTGAMRMPRKEMAEFATKHGFVPIDSVSRGLDILVVADGSDKTSSKCQKAEKFGTKIMTENEFLTGI